MKRRDEEDMVYTILFVIIGVSIFFYVYYDKAMTACLLTNSPAECESVLR